MSGGVLRSTEDIQQLAATLPAPTSLGQFVQPKNAVLLSAPFSFGVDSADLIRVRIWFHPVALWLTDDRVFNLTIRMVRLDGTGQVTDTELRPTLELTKNEFFVTLDDGAIQTVSLVYSGLALSSMAGPVYAVVDLLRGTPTGARKIIGTFLAGYIGQGQPATWPGTPILGPLEGTGYERTLAGAGTVGNEVSTTVPQGLVWRLSMIAAEYTASGAAASRRPAVVIAPTGNVGARLSSPQAITAGQVCWTTWIPGAALGVGAALLDGVAPLPPNVMLRANSTISTATAARQAGDQYTQFNITAAEYIDPIG